MVSDGLAPDSDAQLTVFPPGVEAPGAPCDAEGAAPCLPGTLCIDRDSNGVPTCMPVTPPQVGEAAAYWNPTTAGFGLHVRGTDAESDVRRVHLQLADADGLTYEWTLAPGADGAYGFDVSMRSAPSAADTGAACDTFQAQFVCAGGGDCESHLCGAPSP